MYLFLLVISQLFNCFLNSLVIGILSRLESSHRLAVPPPTLYIRNGYKLHGVTPSNYTFYLYHNRALRVDSMVAQLLLRNQLVMVGENRTIMKCCSCCSIVVLGNYAWEVMNDYLSVTTYWINYSQNIAYPDTH